MAPGVGHPDEREDGERHLPGDDDAGDEATDTRSHRSVVERRGVSHGTFVEGTTTFDESVERSHGYEFGCTFTMDDPRVSGDLTAHGDSDCIFDPATQAFTCLGRSYEGVLTGPEGTWVGGSVGVDHTYVGFFEGTGAYEGLTFAHHSLENGDIRGVIYQGSPLPAPWEPLPPPASE